MPQEECKVLHGLPSVPSASGKMQVYSDLRSRWRGRTLWVTTFVASSTLNTASIRRSRLSEGLPYPLGAMWDGLGVNFALFSAHALKVELCLFDAAGEREI